MDVDKAKRDEAISRFVSHAGSSREAAEKVVDSALQAAIDQTLEMIAGAGSFPSAPAAFRADQARYVCQRANRILGQREVEVLFRTTPQSARSILTSMRATYEEPLHDQFLERMRDDAAVTATGTEDTGLTWSLRFSEQATFELAYGEIVRLGLASRIVDSSPTRRTVTLPRIVKGDKKSEDTLALLGIDAPSEE